MIWLIGRGINPVAMLLPTQENINTDRHPCLDWYSNSDPSVRTREELSRLGPKRTLSLIRMEISLRLLINIVFLVCIIEDMFAKGNSFPPFHALLHVLSSPNSPLYSTPKDCEVSVLLN